MKTITVEVQLAPCEAGADIFMPTEELVRVEGATHYKSKSKGSRSVAIYRSEFPEIAHVTKPIKATLTIKIEREEGYYWVNNRNDKSERGWVVRYWNGEMFTDLNRGKWEEDTYSEIDERKIERLPE